MSEYFDDVPIGAVGPNGVRCEDISRLTYGSDSFDIVISQDVMEHVSDPLLGFAEIGRVLRPGGSHLFTTPRNVTLANSIPRARLGPNGVEHLLPAEYHGDPIRKRGALVFTDFGADLATLLQRLRDAFHRTLAAASNLCVSGGHCVRGSEVWLARRFAGGVAEGSRKMNTLSSAERDRLFAFQESRNEFEALIEKFYSGLVRSGDTVIDGGAHCAMHTLPLARLVGANGRVLAFEPVPTIAQYLRSLTADFPQVSVYEAAISAEGGVRPFIEITDAPWLSSARPRNLGGSYVAKTVSVEHARLDKFAELPVTFIKLDLEGGEYDALRGGRGLLNKHRPVIVFECGRMDTALAYGYTAEDFFGLFEGYGYNLIDIFGKQFLRSDFSLPQDSREVPHYVVATPSSFDQVAPVLLANARASITF